MKIVSGSYQLPENNIQKKHKKTLIFLNFCNIFGQF